MKFKSLLCVVLIASLFGTIGCSGSKKKDNAIAKEKKRPSLVKRKTSEVLDMKKAMAENPNLIEVKNVIKGKDPISTSLSGYIHLASKINVDTFNYQVRILKATEDRNPTYDEIVQFIKECKVKFNALPDNQKYAYDEREAKFTILEDPTIESAFHGKEIKDDEE